MAFDPREEDILQRLANAFQPATLVSTRLRRGLETALQYAIEAEAALHRSTRAMHELRSARSEETQ